MTYSAERARLLRDGMEARLVMLDGIALSPGPGASLNTVTFDQFVFDLSDIISDARVRTPRPAEYFVTQLLSPTVEMLATGRYARGEYVSEGHYKLALPLLAMIYPMIALVTLLAGGYRRSGFGRRVVVAIAISSVLQIGLLMLRERVQRASRALAADLCADARRRCLCRRTGPLAQRRLPAARRSRMTLWVYILRVFLRSVAGVFAVIAMVLLLFGFVENLRRFGNSEATTGDIIRISLLQAPEPLYQALPLVVLLASLVTFLRLARTSELVVMRAAGVSAIRLIGIPVVASLRLARHWWRRPTLSSRPPSSAGSPPRTQFRGDGASLLSFSPKGCGSGRPTLDGRRAARRAARR